MATTNNTIDADVDLKDVQINCSTPAEAEETGVDTAHGHTPNGANADVPDDELQPALKKKKKKKSKKSSKANGAQGATEASKDGGDAKPLVLCISRNKHWKYISSYHVSLEPFECSVLWGDELTFG